MPTRRFGPIGHLFQLFSVAVIVIAAATLFITTTLSALHILPWLQVNASFGEENVPWAGQALQISATVLLCTLALGVPSSLRVARLEYEHRRFEISMDDITKAYRAAHMADRADMFEMVREFDAVRERYRYLKEESNLSEMDEELVTIAAQMSEQSRDLADRFSSRRMERLRVNLIQRNEDLDAMKSQVSAIKTHVHNLARRSNSYDISEDELVAQIASAQTELDELKASRGSRADIVKLQR